jgi:hypothetical protein
LTSRATSDSEQQYGDRSIVVSSLQTGSVRNTSSSLEPVAAATFAAAIFSAASTISSMSSAS